MESNQSFEQDRLFKSVTCYFWRDMLVFVPWRGARVVQFSSSEGITAAATEDDDVLWALFLEAWRWSNIFEYDPSTDTRESYSRFTKESLRTAVGARDIRQIERERRSSVIAEHIDGCVYTSAIEPTQRKGVGRMLLDLNCSAEDMVAFRQNCLRCLSVARAV